MQIVPADLDDPHFVAFVRAHLDDIAPTAPSESQHAYGVEQLRGLRVWTVQSSERIVGMAALAPLTEGTEELKSMRTDPSFRGRGVASRVLAYVLDDAAERGIRTVLLETGSMEFFAPARSLYRAFGFRTRGPFGSYVDDPNSVFMQLHLPGGFPRGGRRPGTTLIQSDQSSSPRSSAS